MLKNYLRTTLRNLTRNAATSSLNILGLAVGMTAAILIFLWVDNELTYDSYHPDADHIYRLTTHYTHAQWTWPSTTYLLAQHLPGELPAVTAIACIQPAYQTNVHLGTNLIAEKNGAYVDNSWFSLFHYDFIAGSPTGFRENPHSLILTQSKAKKYFGTDNPIGQTISIDSTPFQVAGIIRDNPANSSFQFDILMPIHALLADPNNEKNVLNWNNYNFQVFVKLLPAASPATVSQAATSILHQNNPPSGENTISLTALKAIHFENDLTAGDDFAHTNSKTVYTFSILGVFLLLIACINYVNLTTAQAGARTKEVGIRKIIGARRISLFSQFFFESMIVSILSLTLTLLLVTLAMPPFRTLSGAAIHNPLANPGSWKIIAITLVSATLLNGVYPALLLSSFKPLNTLKNAVNIKFKDFSLRKGLVVLQFTFSIILMASTFIIRNQLQYIRQTSPGYNRSQLFTFVLPGSMIAQKTQDQTKAKADAIKQQLLAHPAITGVSFASESIVSMNNSNEGSAGWDGKDPNFVPVVFQFSADECFKTTLALDLQKGRWFDPQQPADQHNFVVNETAIQRLNIRRPVIGQRFFFQGDTGRIIGIVKDFHYASMHEPIGPLVIMNRPSWRSLVYVKTSPGKTSEALTAARTVWSQLVPNQPFDYTFLDEAFDNLYKADTRTSTLILVFSAMAILISCLGLLGLAAFTAQTRIREIGIRKVLGATVTNILTLLSRDFIKLVIVSVLIATPIAWWAMHSWLQDFAYHIPLSPWVFAAAGGLAIAIALLTVGTQSLRAARTNPIKNLRTL